MERQRFRSTSMIDLMADLHQRDLLDEARRLGDELRVPKRRRAGPFGLQIFGRRPRKG
jgi:hypothetical protein